jgi:quercetin 2,3-dioxygenase
MIKIIPSEQRHRRDFGWLDARWHFSFSDYYDPENTGWGPLRVFNDDVIQGGGGFGAHPHRDMEIVTIVLEGILEHSDSLGHRAQIRPGEVQMMSAGTGITHAEYNESNDDPVHLLQLWIEPRTKGLTPRYEQKTFANADRQDKLLPVVSSGGVPGTLTIDQDAIIYVSRLNRGQRVEHELAPPRRAYLFLINGLMTINGQPLRPGDQARVVDETRLSFTASEPSEFVLLDLP